jgi:hypothetical protein
MQYCSFRKEEEEEEEEERFSLSSTIDNAADTH